MVVELPRTNHLTVSDRLIIPVVQTIEVPHIFDPSHWALSKRLDRAILHPEEGVSTVAILVQALRNGFLQNKELSETHTINNLLLTRRKTLGLMVGGGLAMVNQTSAKQIEIPTDEEAEIYTNTDNWHFKTYYPYREKEAHTLGQMTLDEIGGPLHVYDVLQWVIKGRETNVRGLWAENITPLLINFVTENNSEAAWNVVGYCLGTAATQIRKPAPSNRVWYPNKDAEPDFGVGDVHIVGMYTAFFMGGVAYRPVEAKRILKNGPTPEMMQNILYFVDRYRNMPPGSDRLPVVEWPLNWYRKTVSINDNDTFTAENFNNPNQPYVTFPFSEAQSIHMPYSLIQAQQLKKSGQLDISDFLMNELGIFRVFGLNEKDIDEFAGSQLAYS